MFAIVWFFISADVLVFRHSSKFCDIFHCLYFSWALLEPSSLIINPRNLKKIEFFHYFNSKLMTNTWPMSLIILGQWFIFCSKVVCNEFFFLILWNPAKYVLPHTTAEEFESTHIIFIAHNGILSKSFWNLWRPDRTFVDILRIFCI